MPRKKTYRHICGKPSITYFKPAGVPLRDITETELTLDEYESIRLADYEGLYQEEAAKLMNISRQTFGRIISSAHQKIAQALINGNAIAIKDKPDE
ncbi:DUF134 domain-containing protein [Carboxylicivirga linearis]|uniref:UPF0251 protein KEM10_09865 n=1 Tax=Carboxylicivirga linearis TaxID=1628157 RepID=A0ABS5JUN4_9BACT|nr:DUF134 domain-containing protein [Carboxylicivirga linearis]MBS2098584.1 DUF134 domain-containing protein [Carboxylicivirga linearis]